MVMLELTEWETGEAVFVLPSAIRSVRQLRAEQCDGQELGRRTRIDTATDMFLVKEDAKEVMDMMGKAASRT